MKKVLLSLFSIAIATMSMAQLNQIDLPITWDDPNVDYTTIGFGSDTAFLSPDPTNASNTVLEVTKPVGAQTWAGIVLGNDSLANAIPFSSGNTQMRAVVYSPAVGTAIRLKVEDETNGAIAVETEVLTTVANAWDTLTFDFANHVSGTPPINFASTYDKIAIFFGFGSTPMTTAETYYLDYVEFFGGSGSGGPTKLPIDFPITFDDSATVDYALIDFGGNASSLAADPANASNVVMKATKTANAQIWAGTSVGFSLANAIPFSANSNSITAVFYSPASGVPMRIKVEDATNPAISVETEVNTTVANAWDTLTFDFTSQVSGTSPINYANTYDKLSVFFNFGSSPTAAEDYYIDNITFGGSIVAPPPSKAPISLPITWDDTANVNYNFIDFGGNSSAIAADPMNASNIVLMSTKTNNSQVWAGTSLGASLSVAIPFAASNTTISAVVYSPDANIPVLLKVEDQTNPSISVETEVNTTVANAWDTLHFDFSNHVPNTPAINFANTYDKVSIFYDFGTAGTGKVYYVDEVLFGTLTSVEDNELIDLNLAVYPNPTTDYLNVDLSSLNEEFNLRIFNISGQEIFGISENAKNLATIDVSSLDNGVYIIQISTEKEVYKSRFVKK